MYDMNMKKIKSKPLFPNNIKLDGMPNMKKPMKPKNNKDRRYWQTNLVPLGDADKDGKLNIVDCYPFDPSRQGIAEIKEKVSEVGGKIKKKVIPTQEEREEKAMKEIEEAEARESFRYILVKYHDNGWVSLGAFTKENIEEELEQIGQNPDIEEIQVTKDSNLVNKLNRKLMLEPIKETAKEAGKYAIKVATEAGERATRNVDIAPKAYKNVKEGLKIKSSAQPDIARFASGPSGKIQRTRIRPPSSVNESSSIGEIRRMPPTDVSIAVEDRPFVDEKPYGYSQRSKNYQEVSAFGPSVVPYRPIARRQVTVPNRPARAPRVGSMTNMGSSERPRGMIPIATIKFAKPISLRFGRRR